MPEPGGLTLDELESLLARVAAGAEVLGLGLTGLRADPASEPKLTRLAAAALG